MFCLCQSIFVFSVYLTTLTIADKINSVVCVYIYICLSTAVGLALGGSTHLHAIHRILMNNELVRMRTEGVVAYFEVLLLHLPGGMERNFKLPQ
jgi:hypothetical protein